MNAFPRMVMWVAAFVVLVGSSRAATSAEPTFVPANDPRIVYEGRIDRRDPAQPVVIWQASRVRVAFEGDAVTLHFGPTKDQVFFDAIVDGRSTVVELREAAAPRPVTLSGFGPGRHELVLFKRSEATAGTVVFRGLEVPAGVAVWKPVVPTYATTMLFLGDSITVGACNEDGAEDQWVNRRTHNAASSWAAFTANAFAADHRNVAVSGMGISTGWFNELAADIWDRLYPTATAPKADLTQWTPKLVFVNFGENDDSFTRAHGQPFPPTFTERYVTLVKAVRAAFPNAPIVLLRGGMTGGATSEPLRTAWEAAVKRLSADDAAVHSYVFKHWSKTHPRVSDDRAMADELIAWLQAQSLVPKRRQER